jgi:23S rRNA G2445 N2-methylase RlmL
MAQFFAATSKGLADALELELKEIGVKTLKKTVAGVYFESSWEGCYRVNLYSRIASRVLKPVLEFTAYDQDELYRHIQKHDFTKYIDSHQTIKVDASVKDCKIHDQRFLAMKTKDAIVDQFREETGERPSIEKRGADLTVHIRGIDNEFSVAIDTSGESLFMRGYRLEAGEAPLKENLAAGLIRLTEWDKSKPIVDLMCGSGTFLIEAALMALNVAPGTLKKGFAFQRFKNFSEEIWEQLLNEAIEGEKEDLDFKFYGFDADKMVLKKAKDNARRAGVDHIIEFKKDHVATIVPPSESGLIIVNPPYGTRIGDEDNLRDVYRDLSFTLKHRFKGWNAWILSGNKDLITDLKLKSTRKVFVYNGPIECRFLKYEMF